MAICRVPSELAPSLKPSLSRPLSHVSHPRTQNHASARRLGSATVDRDFSLAALSTETVKDNRAAPSPRTATTEPVVVLFKHDLRVRHHSGLQLAIRTGQPIIPLYCLDPELLYPLATSPGSVALLHGSLHALRISLRNSGSDLVVRRGRLSETVIDVMKTSGARSIVMEKEVDSRWREAIDQIRIEASDFIIKQWSSASTDSSTDDTSLEAASFSDVSVVPEGVDVGALPEVEDLREMLGDGGMMLDLFGRRREAIWEEWSSALTSHPDACLHLLRSYLQPTRTDRDGSIPSLDLLRRLTELNEDGSFPGVSFAPLFCPALSLGLISPEQVRKEIRSAQGWSPWRSSFLRAAYRNTLSYDRCSQLHGDILINGCSGTPGENAEQKLWKWQAMTAEYSIVRPKTSSSKGAVVLVHGFGATCMHWRRNVDDFASAGYTVYCPTLPGYGRTQTLYMKYTQAVWKAFLTSFLREIVGRPVVLAGNSIGAFVAAATAADHPDLVEALILINPAGPLNADYLPGDEDAPVLKKPPPAFFVDVFSKCLLLYLSLSAGRILKSVYPVNKDRADAAFLEEILEASKDPNADAVMKSAFFLKKPIALNYLLKDMYKKPVLLLQGALDPLNNAEERARQMRDLCPNVQVEVLDAGHCPHDEAPELVNPRFLAFLRHLHEGTRE